MSKRIYFAIDKKIPGADLVTPQYAMMHPWIDDGTSIAKSFDRANKGKAIKTFARQIDVDKYEMIVTRPAPKRFGGGYVFLGSTNVTVDYGDFAGD